MLICEFCGRKAKSNKSNWIHQSRCSANPNRFHQVPWNKGVVGKQIAWNKGKTGFKGTPHSEETKKRLSAVAKERSLGGYVKGSGRGKKGWYKGIFCDSSWELAFVLYHIDRGVEIRRCDEKRTYEWQGKKRTYMPDFVVEDTIYEIKGFETEQSKEKAAQHADIIVINKEKISMYLEYAVLTYGKDFVKLYKQGV